MKYILTRFGICFVLASGFLSPSASPGGTALGTQVFDHSADGFRLELSQDWKEIPKATMEIFNTETAKQYPRWIRPALHYGYQKRTTNESSSPACILIRVSYLGRCPDMQFVKNELVNYKIESLKAEFGDPTYDADLEAFVVPAQIKSNGTLLFTNLNAFFPTKDGIVKVFCYSPMLDIRDDPRLFRRVLKGVRIDGSQKPAVPGKGRLILCVVAVLILVLVLWRAKSSTS